MTHIDNIIVDNYYYIMKAISENINEYNPGQTIDDLECNCDGKIPADNPERANFFRYNMICRKDFCNNCVIKDDIRDENPFDRCGICNGKGCARNGWDPVNETWLDGKKYKNDEKTHKKTTALYCEDNGFWWDHNNERCLYNKIYKDDEEGGETAQQKCENDIHKWDPLNGSCSDLMSQNQAECESKKAEWDPVNETCTNGNTYNTTQTAREKCETNNGGQFYSSNKTCEILHLSYNDDDELISPEQQCKNSPRKWFEGTLVMDIHMEMIKILKYVLHKLLKNNVNSKHTHGMVHVVMEFYIKIYQHKLLENNVNHIILNLSGRTLEHVVIEFHIKIN